MADGVLGVLLTTEFLVGSLGQGYYSMLLFPMLASVLLPGSPMRNWPALAGCVGAFTFDSLYSDRWEAFGRILEYNKVTIGWSLLMIAVFCSLLFRYLDMRTAGVEGRCWKNGHDARFHGRRRWRGADTRGYRERMTDFTALSDDEWRERLTPGRVQGAPPGRHRSTVHRRVHRHQNSRGVPVSGLRYRTVPQ